jgi:hypothetical protein
MYTLIADIKRLDAAIDSLQRQFANLTRAHGAGVNAVSVSDPFDDGSIDATFHGMLVKFRLLYTYTVDGEPIGRVLALHCHSAFGTPTQAQLGEFTVNEQGFTNLPPDAAGKVPNLQHDPAMIVLSYLRKALNANASLSG